MSGINFNVTDNKAASEDLQGAAVDDLVSLSGVAINSVDLGTFTGTTIPDSSTIKEALQELETAIESAGGGLSSATDLDAFLDNNNDDTSSSFTLYHGVSTPTVGNEVFDITNNIADPWGTNSNLFTMYRTDGNIGLQISPNNYAIFAREGAFGLTLASSDDYSYGLNFSESLLNMTPASVVIETTYQEDPGARLTLDGNATHAQGILKAGSVEVIANLPVSGLDGRVELKTFDTSARVRQIDTVDAFTPIWDVRESTNVRFGVVKNGGLIVGRRSTAVSASTLQETIIAVTDTSAARTITLDSDDCKLGRIIIVKDESGGANTNNITVDTEGAELIDGSASITITADYGVVRLYSNGTNWFSF